jgi:CRP-like cAMP-binding protein
MAVLCDEPRSATVVASEDARILTLQDSRVKELIFEMPEIAFDFFHVLTTRLNTANRRYEELVQSARAD